jgi:hypothetical protein
MARNLVPAIAAPPRWVGYGTLLILCLFIVVSGYLQASTGLVLFATIYWAGLAFLLISYWLRELIAEYKVWTAHLPK